LLWDNFLGKQYEPDGRGPDFYDCYGLCISVLKEQGVEIPDIQVGQELSTQHHRFLYESATNFKKVQKPLPFCLVAFSLKSPYVNHIGVVHPDKDKFIHLLNRRPVCVENLNLLSWKNRLVGYYVYGTVN